jgi:hypothetical protein
LRPHLTVGLPFRGELIPYLSSKSAITLKLKQYRRTGYNQYYSAEYNQYYTVSIVISSV